MTVRVYKSTDRGAPQINDSTGGKGTLNAVLKACLVNGYGADADLKEPAGWSIPFEDSAANILVIRPASGARYFYQVIDNYNYTAVVNMFSAMTSASEGLEPSSTATYRLSRRCPDWMIIADERTAYICLKYTTYKQYGVSVLGDYYSLKSTDSSNAALIIPPQTSDTNSRFYSGAKVLQSGTADAAFIAKNLDGTSYSGVGNIGIRTGLLYTNGAAGNNVYPLQGSYGYDTTYAPILLYVPSSYIHIGWLRGVLIWGCSDVVSTGTLVDINGTPHMAIRYAWYGYGSTDENEQGTYYGTLFISLGSWEVS